MWRHDDRHCASPREETKNVKDKPNVSGDVKIISEERKKYCSITFVHSEDLIQTTPCGGLAFARHVEKSKSRSDSVIVLYDSSFIY